MSTNLYGIANPLADEDLPYEWETGYSYNPQDVAIKVINGTLHCWAHAKENIFNLFDISMFTSSVAFVGTDLLKELFGSRSW